MYAPKITPTLDTAAYAIGDVLFAPTEVKLVTPQNGGACCLIGFQVIDESDQSPAFDIFIMDDNVPLGTVNGVPNIADALASGDILGGPFSIPSTGWSDLGGVRSIKFNIDPHIMNCKVGFTSVYITAVVQSALTFAADSIKIRPMFM